jgi:hypothetical protein
MAETKTAQVNLRMQPSFKRALEKAAVDDRRSITGLIEKLLHDYLRKRGYLKLKGRRYVSSKAHLDNAAG